MQVFHGWPQDEHWLASGGAWQLQPGAKCFDLQKHFAYKYFNLKFKNLLS